MKKHLLFLAAMLATAAANAQERFTQVWDFTQPLSDQTVTWLDADTENWVQAEYDENQQTSRWYNRNNSVIVGNVVAYTTDGEGNPQSNALTEFSGLEIGMGTAKNTSNNLILWRNGKMRLTRNGMTIGVPKLYNGQTISITARSANTTATDRGIEPVQDHLQLISGTTTDGQCLFLGSEVEGSLGDYTFTWKVVTESEEPVDVSFRIISGGVDFIGIAVSESEDRPETYVYNKVCYLLREDGTACISYVTEYDWVITIPESFLCLADGKTYRVTEMAVNAFNGSYQEFQLHLPNSITEIPEGAFKDNQWLQYISLPYYLTKIGNAAFKGCTALQNISLYNTNWDQDIEIGTYTFQNCTALSYVYMDGNIKELPHSMFRGCTNLQFVYLPTCLERIREAAFMDDVSLTSITLPASMNKKIHSWAFQRCTNLRYVVSLASTPITLEVDVFNDIASDAMLIVPEGCTDAYTWDRKWSPFTTVREIVFPTSYTPFYLQNVATGQMIAFDDNKNLMLSDNGAKIELMGTWCGGYNPGINYSLVCPDLRETLEDGGEQNYSIGAYSDGSTYVGQSVASSFWTILKGSSDGAIRIRYNICEPQEWQAGYLAVDPNNISSLVANGSEDDYSLWRIVYPEDQPEVVAESVFAANVGATAGSSVTMPIEMHSNQEYTGMQFDLVLPEGVSIPKNGRKLDVTVTDERTASFTVSGSQQTDDDGNPTNVWRFVVFSMEGSAISAGDGTVLNATLSVDGSVADGDYEIRITNIQMSTSTNNTAFLPESTVTLTIGSQLKGDVNGDGIVNIADVTALVSSILGNTKEYSIQVLDVNGDGIVNIADVTATVSIILGN